MDLTSTVDLGWMSSFVTNIVTNRGLPNKSSRIPNSRQHSLLILVMFWAHQGSCMKLFSLLPGDVGPSESDEPAV